MKCLSSIFSFDTLKLSASQPAAICLCLCLVLAAEFAARVSLQLGYIDYDKSLQKDIEQNILTIKRQKPNTWLIGNSTLEFIRHEDLRSVFGSSFIKITHGGANVQGSAALTDLYLDLSSVVPKEVVFFVIKDDVNANGLNTETSKHYLSLMTWKRYLFWNYSKLRSVRKSLYHKILNAWSKYFVDHASLPQWNKQFRLVRLPHIDQKAITQAMMDKYHFDPAGFSMVADICYKCGVKQVSVVILPISEAYAQWHNRMYPRMTCRHISKRVREECASERLRCIDISDPLPGDFFRDYFHLNDFGSEEVEERLSSFF